MSSSHFPTYCEPYYSILCSNNAIGENEREAERCNLQLWPLEGKISPHNIIHLWLSP